MSDAGAPSGATVAAPFEAITGETYFKRIMQRECNRRARAHFLELALQLVPPGALLFDFGCGPGIDARFYAERGYTVAAYDVDPKMCEFCSGHCRDHIDAGRVRLEVGEYRQFLAGRAASTAGRVDLVVSNFAPLNQIDDLGELFEKFHALTHPGGKVFVSVLSPYFVRDARRLWWWRSVPLLWRRGERFFPGGRAPPHYRRTLSNLAASSLPYFKLVRVFRGLPPRLGRQARGIDVSGGLGSAWLRLATSEFMFLLFHRDR